MSTVLQGRVALITGSGGGLGRAHALAFAREGAKVVVNDPGRSPQGGDTSRGPADTVVAEIRAAGGDAVACYDSVADHAQAGRIVQCALDTFGRLDIVINNASVFHGGLFDELSEADWDEQLGVHVKGAFNVCKHALPLMAAQRWGRVINTSSHAAFGGVGFAAYSTAKAALLGFTYALAGEYWRHGVTVNVVLPNAGTPHRLIEGQQWMDRVASRGFVPPGTGVPAPPPEFVPPLFVYLASEAGAAVSGKTFEAAGGNIGIYGPWGVSTVLDKPQEGGPWTQAELVRDLPAALVETGLRGPGVG